MTSLASRQIIRMCQTQKVWTSFKSALVNVTLSSLHDTKEFTVIIAKRRNPVILQRNAIVHFVGFLTP